ncbi:MAG: pyruvate formate lyase family protein [Christensenellales bacterium]|jgi:pyruvate-formate lyase
MTERISRLKRFILEKKHHAFRCEGGIDCHSYRDPALSGALRTALRLKASLEAETPVLLDGERIALLRTRRNAPRIFSDFEWDEITSRHKIHENGNVCNISPDYEKILKEGLQAQLEKLEGRTSESAEAMRTGICAVLDFAARYAVHAREAGREDIALRLDKVPRFGAETFPEALQSLRVLHYAMWCEGNYHNTLGRFDQYMRPYYEGDKARGMTDEEALEWIEEFFLSCNRDSDLYPGMQQGDNGQSMVLGGMTKGGEDGYSKLSELCLIASGELRVIDPKINLRVNAKTPLGVYIQGTRLTKLGLGFPQYENDDVVIPGLMKLGYAEEDARDYVVAACWEFIIPGVAMDIPNIGAVPLAAMVKEAAVHTLETARCMDDVLADVKKRIFSEVRAIAKTLDNLYIIPSPYMSLFFDGCLENERDISLGNKYNNYGLHGTGLATAADSLAAIEQCIFREGMEPQKLLAALETDFEGAQELQHHLKFECPKMGNDDDRADKYAPFLLDAFSDAVKGIKNERGGIFRAGTGSAMYYIWHASDIGATPDGRRAEEPLPANYAPALNVKVDGPASILRSFAKPDLSNVINGGPLTIEFHDSVFRSDEAIEKVAMLVRSFMLDGGHQLQLNTVNRETLLDAQKHPENYRNLIVRVWGWSGYFVELDKCYQDHIIQRVELTA